MDNFIISIIRSLKNSHLCMSNSHKKSLKTNGVVSGFEGGQADDTSAVNQTSVSQRRLMGPGRPKRARHRETPDPSPATSPGRLRPRCAVHEAVDAG